MPRKYKVVSRQLEGSEQIRCDDGCKVMQTHSIILCFCYDFAEEFYDEDENVAVNLRQMFAYLDQFSLFIL